MKQNKEIPAGYKDSPLGIIPEDWQVRNFHEISTEVRLGGNYENSEYNCGIPVIKMGNVGRGNISTEMVQYLPETENYNNSDILKRDDLLFNTRNTLELVGKVAIWKEELPYAIYNSNLLRVYFDSNYVFSNSFMNYNFNGYSSLKQLKKYATGTTSVAAIYTRDLNQIKFALPLLNEQRKIVEILETWDNAIVKQQKMVEKLERRKRGLMQQLLTARIRISGFSGSWQTIKMGDVFKRITRKNVELNDNVVTISAQKGFIKQTDFFNKTIASEIIDNYFLVKKGEFCYNKSYSKGYPMGVVKLLSDFDKAVVTTLYICFALKSADNSVEFFKHYFDSGSLNRELTKIANEGGRAHGLLNVTPSDFFDIHIRIPIPEERIAISEILFSMDKLIELERKKLQMSCIQKRNLMQQLLTGKTRVKL